jgi:hypothetical protein
MRRAARVGEAQAESRHRGRMSSTNSFMQAPESRFLTPCSMAKRLPACRRPNEQQAEAQPLLEQRLLHVFVAPRLAQLDHDLLAQALVAGLLLDDLLRSPRGTGGSEHSSYSLSCQKPPRS